MEIRRVCVLYFSATGNTEKAAGIVGEALAEQLGRSAGADTLCDASRTCEGIFLYRN